MPLDEPNNGLSEKTEWPAVGWEQCQWRADAMDFGSRRQRRRHQGPYSAAIPARIADIDPVLPTSLIAESEDAAAQIVRFDEYVAEQLGEGMGEIGPMAAVLLRSESASSSQIENLTVGARQLALAELGENASSNAGIVLSNVQAMTAASHLAGGVDAQSILAMHEALLAGSQPAHAGRFRKQQVWIGGSGIGPHHADFVPPHESRVPDAIHDLTQFIDRDNLPVLPQIAIAHAQFETIHPFTDGNGRTGRAIVQAMLRHKDLSQRVTVPLSAGFLSNTGQYFDALTSYRQGSAVPIIQSVNAAAFSAMTNGRQLVDDLKEIRAHGTRNIRARKDAAVWRLHERVIAQPVINTNWVVEQLGVSDVAAVRAIGQLVEAGVLTQSNSRARNRVWECRAVLHALDDFASRAGRRASST